MKDFIDYLIARKKLETPEKQKEWLTQVFELGVAMGITEELVNCNKCKFKGVCNE